MSDKERKYLEELEEQLKPIINHLAETYTKNDSIRIEYPVGVILISFK